MHPFPIYHIQSGDSEERIQKAAEENISLCTGKTVRSKAILQSERWKQNSEVV
jgi:hypothetical protein